MQSVTNNCRRLKVNPSEKSKIEMTNQNSKRLAVLEDRFTKPDQQDKILTAILIPEVPI